MPGAVIDGDNGPVTTTATGKRLLHRLLDPVGALPPLTWRGQLFDIAVALALTLTAVAVTGGATLGEPRPPGPFVPFEPHRPGWALLTLAVVAPLTVRRRWPLATLSIVLATTPLVAGVEAALRLSFYACVIAAYTAAVYSPYRIPALAGLPVAVVLHANLQNGPPAVPAEFVPFLILAPVAVAADGLRRWRRRAGDEHARHAALERQQAEELRRAAGDERARIARELHDVVTHNVSMMIIQAGAARKIMDAQPAQAREALLSIEAGGRAAMTELRHVMGLLAVDGTGTDLAPQPGLDRLPALVAHLARGGIDVTLATTGRPRPVPDGVGLAAYRVAQEALTNTVTHAAGAAAQVRVDYADDGLRIEVVDTGGAETGAGTGRGLLGLRERVAVYGGALHAGPRLTGGWRVDARIPWEEP